MALLAQQPALVPAPEPVYNHVQDYTNIQHQAQSTAADDSSGSCSDEDVEARGCQCFPTIEDCPGDTRVDQAMKHVRLGFIRKVYAILIVQLFVTIAIAAPLCLMSKQWVLNHIYVFRIARWVSLGVIIGMTCCCRQAARNFPTNYLLLFAFTASEAVVIGFVGALYETNSVLIAAGVTVAACVGLSAYASFTNTDYTGYGPYLFVVLFTLCLWSFIAILFPMDPLTHKVLAAIGTLLFCCYIVYDTQLIIGGRHKVQFNIDDYVFAALNLYLDIVNLFLFILSLFGKRR
jgi:FtsH-binding integral membrane protein